MKYYKSGTEKVFTWYCKYSMGIVTYRTWLEIEYEKVMEKQSSFSANERKEIVKEYEKMNEPISIYTTTTTTG